MAKLIPEIIQAVIAFYNNSIFSLRILISEGFRKSLFADQLQCFNLIYPDNCNFHSSPQFNLVVVQMRIILQQINSLKHKNKFVI